MNMWSRTLVLAAVVLWTGAAMGPAAAQENLEAGKTPSQLFAATCALCHKSPRGLVKTVSPGSLPGFLRQHYTTSTNMAGALSAYLLSNGATDTRMGGDNLTTQGRESRSEPKPSAENKPGVAAEEQGKRGRRSREAAKPDESAKPGAAEPQGEGTPKGKKPKFDRHKPKNAGPKDEPAAPTPEAKPDVKLETPPAAATAPAEAPKTDTSKSDTNKTDASKADTTTRPDPVPPVTPAPDTASKPAEDKPVEDKAALPSSGMPVFVPEKPAASSEPAQAPAAAPSDAPASSDKQ